MFDLPEMTPEAAAAAKEIRDAVEARRKQREILWETIEEKASYDAGYAIAFALGDLAGAVEKLKDALPDPNHGLEKLADRLDAFTDNIREALLSIGDALKGEE